MIYIILMGLGWFKVDIGILGSGWSGNGKWNDRYNSISRLNLYINNILRWLINIFSNNQ